MVDDRRTLLKGFELGLSDVIFKPYDGLELLARTRAQIRRKRYTDFLRQSLDRSLEAAVMDPLTGLNNRRFMSTQMTQLMAIHMRGGTPWSLLMLDIDFFKRVNDTHGHDAGDAVLKEFAKRLADNVRAQDMPCRMGGEEFVVLMPNTATEDALGIAERVRTQVAAQPFFIKGLALGLDITVSVGVSTSSGLSDTIEAMTKRADEAVYVAKKDGRNRVVIGRAA